ncbi:hypothetical protein HELRODRAFT_159003 [Helobdella robusta]|uniref:Uncharacterized protein n=1 Tax=Helobdella robusta TaxID=6412 RepID=T1ENH1_HELRO|nr:hypothetical protein HELRODRAFT_159003 [Helobdella robusta]ESO12468.1 hypothetical protein HELRODRAFT_159003 [Helobdella robusta]
MHAGGWLNVVFYAPSQASNQDTKYVYCRLCSSEVGVLNRDTDESHKERNASSLRRNLICVVPGCQCLMFNSSAFDTRLCGHCGHTWFAHVISSTWTRQQSKVEENDEDDNDDANTEETSGSHISGMNERFDSKSHQEHKVELGPLVAMTSLVLFGVQAVSAKLKILLDRIFGQYGRECCQIYKESDDVIIHMKLLEDLLKYFGWTWDDYTRGYLLKMKLYF